MDVLADPFVRLWNWIDRVGGYPGKMVFICVIVMAVIAGFTWYGNKR